MGGYFAGSSEGYPGTLWISFGLSLLCSGLAFLFLPSSTSDQSHDSIGTKNLDFIGALMVTTATAILVFGFTEAPTGWRQAKVIVPILIGGLLFVLFFLWELYLDYLLPNTEPLLPSKVWNYPNLVAVTAQSAFQFGGFYLFILNSVNLFINIENVRYTLPSNTTLLKLGIQNRPLKASLKFGIPVTVGVVFFLVALGPFYNHRFFPPKWMLVLGSTATCAGLIVFASTELHSSYWHYPLTGCILIAFGIAIFFINYLNVLYASTPLEDQGLISGIVQT